MSKNMGYPLRPPPLTLEQWKVRAEKAEAEAAEWKRLHEASEKDPHHSL